MFGGQSYDPKSGFLVQHIEAASLREPMSDFYVFTDNDFRLTEKTCCQLP
jgi:hypothetical protein